MRILQLAVSTALVCVAFSVSAQTPVIGPSDDWRRVEQLSPHTKIKISADHKHANCFVDSVDDQKLVCSHSSKGGVDSIEFSRQEISKIKLSRQGHSAVGGLGLGAAIGVGAGGGILEGINHANNPGGGFVTGKDAFGVGAAIGGVLGAGIGALVGHSTDWLAGPVIYARH
jgi:hypothetical protein